MRECFLYSRIFIIFVLNLFYEKINNMLYNFKIVFIAIKKVISLNFAFYSLALLALSAIVLISFYVTTVDIKYGSIFILSFILLLIFLTFMMDFIKTYKKEKNIQRANELNKLRNFTMAYINKIKYPPYSIVSFYVSSDIYYTIPTITNVDYNYVIILDENRHGYDIGLYRKGTIVNNVNEFFYE
jgi:hypothetical protein